MSKEKIAFKSFYYSLGTTSFRMKNFNQKIEQQLDLLNQFWQKPEYKDQKWENKIAYKSTTCSWLNGTYVCVLSHSVVSDSLQPHELQHVRLLCPSLSPRVCSNSCSLSQ